MGKLFTTHNGEVFEINDSPGLTTDDAGLTPHPSPVMFVSSTASSSFPADATPQPSPLIFSPLSMAATFTPPLDPPTPTSTIPFPLSPLLHPREISILRSGSPKPIITLTDAQHLPASPKMAKPCGQLSPVKSEKIEKIRSIPKVRPRAKRSSAAASREEDDPVSWMVYNEYGELVTIEQLSRPLVAEELTVTQALRLVYKTYHAEFKDQMREVLNPLFEGNIQIIAEGVDKEPCDPITATKYYKDKVSSWMFSPSPDPREMQDSRNNTPDEEALHTVPVCSGPPRVLDIGCGDGRWCKKTKIQYPEWIVEGVDEIDQWTKLGDGSPPRDFMEPLLTNKEGVEDYFCNVHRSQHRPEFTCRNINQLVSHDVTIPQNLYSLIRGRDVFGRVESYKNFLEDVRHLLRPSGVVELIEVDPRPRCNLVGRRHSAAFKHRSGAATDWTDKISDRFVDPYDAQLATSVPGWTARVEERLKASLRPRDGVPAANIKSWLQGAGFWDVKQMVIRIPIGGQSYSGQKLRQLLIQEIEIENSIPILAAKLPPIELNDLSLGYFYLNLHVVTARKPKFPRPGDLLMNGTRQEMVVFKHEKIGARETAGSNNRAFSSNMEKKKDWNKFDMELCLSNTLTSVVFPPAHFSPKRSE